MASTDRARLRLVEIAQRRGEKITAREIKEILE